MTDPTPHDIVIVVPVADRPRHLSECLNTLLELIRRYPYAGKVSVLVAEDSLDTDSIDRHRAITASVTQQGIATHHLGPDEQKALVDALPQEARAALADIIGDGTTYAHKGASITRNIAYLWLNRLQADGRKRLFWFIDSDQEFRVNVAADSGEQQVYAIDYCNALDRIFNETPAKILTGKVVGDPPVSPAVMAGNFLDDVAAFLTDMAQCAPQQPCSFHGAGRHADDAAYHDMAGLFGFKAAEVFRYQCTLDGAHDHAACYTDFARKLAHFFDGEHPTRRSVYEDADLMATVKPARTIYTGNYVFTADCLDWFIPFAALRLRMAGPTLGRIIKAELGEQFVSANLPMLHKRTVEELGQSEFRPGIERAAARVDLSGEFERQYFGDVMLFSMQRLTVGCAPRTNTLDTATVGCAPRTNTPDTATVGCAPRTEPQTVRNAHPTRDEIGTLVADVETGMHEMYATKHREIADKIDRLRALFDAPEHWWRQDAGLDQALALFKNFIDNMQNNFGDDSRAWQIVNGAAHRARRLSAIAEAISRYREDRDTWHSALTKVKTE
ncbi:MAG: hypothetical protein CVV05_16235 [Gammaproteobacteria bacterium HGW-Gammaproteobacteria-1]|jgi:hypothetical protein|nr:MAG: hypothetical protein CVV05_16235 [Gammaproteobacteria bacterium HGW-Gammaproteobacteria-1]